MLVSIKEKPLAAKTLADALVFTPKPTVTEYGIEAAHAVLDAIKELGVTGKIEFMSHDVLMTGDYVLCVGLAAAKGSCKGFSQFSKELRDAVGRHCIAHGKITFNRPFCESNELGQLRRSSVNRATVTFDNGLPVSISHEGDVQSNWATIINGHAERFIESQQQDTQAQPASDETRRDPDRDLDTLKHYPCFSSAQANFHLLGLEQNGYPVIHCRTVRDCGDIQSKLAKFSTGDAILFLDLNPDDPNTHIVAVEQFLPGILDDFLFRIWPEGFHLHLIYYGDWSPMCG